MTRAIVVGGPAAGKIEYPLGRSHGDRWRIMTAPRIPVTGIGEAVPTQAAVDYVDYTVRQFTCSGREIFVLAPPEWTDLDVMGELLTVYQQVKCDSD